MLNKGDKVIINTDTIFDEDGIPVTIRNGAKAHLHEIDGDWCQVIVQWIDGPELLGVGTKYLTSAT